MRNEINSSAFISPAHTYVRRYQPRFIFIFYFYYSKFFKYLFRYDFIITTCVCWNGIVVLLCTRARITRIHYLWFNGGKRLSIEPWRDTRMEYHNIVVSILLGKKHKKKKKSLRNSTAPIVSPNAHATKGDNLPTSAPAASRPRPTMLVHKPRAVFCARLDLLEYGVLAEYNTSLLPL
jgi:hypothetical protein